MSKIKKIILEALLLASTIILSRFLSVTFGTIKVTFAFIPIMLVAIWLGPIYGIFNNVVADVIGALWFPTGPYYFGWTLSTGLSGLIYGLLLYKKKKDTFKDTEFILRVIFASLIVTVFLHIMLNTLWLANTIGKSYKVLVISRYPKELIKLFVQIIIILGLEKAVRRPFDKYIRDDND